jgi:hypothetical protein
LGGHIAPGHATQVGRVNGRVVSTLADCALAVALPEQLGGLIKVLHEVVVIELGRVRITKGGHQPPAGMNGTFEIYAVEIEDDGNPPGHREADEDDF